MDCFDSTVPQMNPQKDDLSIPVYVECRRCGVSVLNADQRAVHQAFHDRVDPDPA